MKKLLIASTVILGLFTVSCSQDEPATTLRGANNQISYSVSADYGSRSTSNYESGLDIEKITVSAWLRGDSTTKPNYEETNVDNYAYFTNDVLTRSGQSGSFDYAVDARYWPANGELLDFFAVVDEVAPFSFNYKEGGDNWIGLDWYTQGNNDDTPDMLYAYVPDQTCTTTNKAQQNVSLSFDHAFAKVTASCEVRNNNLRVYVTDMAIRGVAKKGRFVFPHKEDKGGVVPTDVPAQWVIGDEFKDIECSLAPFDKNNPIILDKAEDAFHTLISDENALMVIPNHYSGRNASAYQTYIELQVYAYNISDASNGYKEGIDQLIFPEKGENGKVVAGTLIIPIEFNWKIGTINHYNIVFDCGNGGNQTPTPNNPGLIRIGYEVEVNDWTTGETIDKEFVL